MSCLHSSGMGTTPAAEASRWQQPNSGHSLALRTAPPGHGLKQQGATPCESPAVPTMLTVRLAWWWVGQQQRGQGL